MGRLIDVADLNIALGMGVLYGNKTAIQVIQEAPTVEAIPKADYEARLRADMVAMLTEIQLEIEEIEMDNNVPCGFEPVNKFYEGISASSKVVQQKINALRGEEDA